LQFWAVHNVAKNAPSLIKIYKEAKEAIKGSHATIEDVFKMFPVSCKNGVINVKVAVNTAIAMQFALHESPSVKKIIDQNDGDYIPLERSYLATHVYLAYHNRLNPRQVVDQIVQVHNIIRAHCKRPLFFTDSNILFEAIDRGISIEEAAMNWVQTRRLMIENGLGRLPEYNKSGISTHIILDEYTVYDVNEDRVKHNLTPEQAILKYKKENGYE
jgi:hypothetical protein